jgi:hypothetical protein
MLLDTFWDLIDQSRRHADDPEERLVWLADQLAERPPAEIVGFDIRLDEVRGLADTWQMWGAAYLICDGLCSDDGFWYFQAWLVGLGRATFERVAADPDSLADVPEVQRLAGRSLNEWAEDEWPDWESLDYVAADAHQRVTGVAEGLEHALEELGHRSQGSPDPSGEQWNYEDTAEAARRLPRVSAMFPLSHGKSEEAS